MTITIDWFNKEHCLIGIQFMDYEAEDILTKHKFEGKCLNIGLAIVTISFYF